MQHLNNLNEPWREVLSITLILITYSTFKFHSMQLTGASTLVIPLRLQTSDGFLFMFVNVTVLDISSAIPFSLVLKANTLS